VADLGRWAKTMSTEELVQSAFKAPLAERHIDETCSALKMSRAEIFDAFAREIAEGYEKKKYAWRDCDAAMNALFGFAYAVSKSDLPDYAFRVYLAFDEGEYHEGGELITHKMLAQIQ
jgi:hypothetical protein